MNVLIVDDSAVMRAMILKTLRLSGETVGEVYQAANGQEGLNALAAHPVDLVFADINMPVMTGDQMIAQMRATEATKRVPVIVVSTDGSAECIEMMRQKGAGFVHKPFTPEILRDRIHEVMGVENVPQSAERVAQSDGPDF